MLLDMTLLENRRVDGHQLYFYQQMAWVPINRQIPGVNVALFSPSSRTSLSCTSPNNLGYN